MRAKFRDVVLTTNGRPIGGATVTVREPGTTTAIAETIYDSGGSVLANPLTVTSTGEIEFYLDDPKRVDLLIEKTGYTSETQQVDVLRPESLDVHESELETDLLAFTTNEVYGRVALSGVSAPTSSTVEFDVSVSANNLGVSDVIFVLVWNQEIDAGESLAAELAVPAFRYPTGSSYESLGALVHPGGSIQAKVRATDLTPGEALTWELQWYDYSGASDWTLENTLTGVDVYEPRIATGINVTTENAATEWANRDRRRFVALGITGADDRTEIYSYENRSGGLQHGTKVATIDQDGEWPLVLRFTPDGQYLFVSKLAGAAVDQIRTSDWGLEREIAIAGSTPYGVACKQDSSKVYVASNGQDTIVPITVSSGAVGSAVATDNEPRYVVRRPGTDELYISTGASSVQKFDATTDTITATLSLGASQNPLGIGFTTDGTKAWVACNTPGVAREIDCATFTLTGRTVTHAGIAHCAVDPEDRTLHTVGADQPANARNWRYWDVATLTQIDGHDFNTGISGLRIAADGAIFMPLATSSRLFSFGGSVFQVATSYYPYHIRVNVKGATEA